MIPFIEDVDLDNFNKAGIFEVVNAKNSPVKKGF